MWLCWSRTSGFPVVLLNKHLANELHLPEIFPVTHVISYVSERHPVIFSKANIYKTTECALLWLGYLAFPVIISPYAWY